MHVPASEWKEDAVEGEMILVRGIIDLFWEEEDGLVLVDYKTDHIPPNREDRLVSRYRTQMAYYQRALEMAREKPVKESWIYSFSLSKAVRVW